MIKEGRIPEEPDTETIPIKEDNEEHEIVKEMMKKYYKIIDFYLETKKLDQVSFA